MTDRAIVIAHRGASGYLPEHTLAGKALAFGLGADYLEQDVVATRDGELVVLHDLTLDDVTDVAERFPRRRRDDGLHYVVDFSLAEIRQLTLFERRLPRSQTQKYPNRFAAGIGAGHVVTLDEELAFVAGLNRSTGRAVGIYSEIKDPAWHREHGIDLSSLLLDRLRAHGYSQRAHAAFVQCFDARELLRVREELACDLRLIQLVDSEPAYAELLTREGLARVARTVHGVGPHHGQVVADARGRPEVTELAKLARDSGLRLHPYTFRREDVPAYAPTLESMLELFLRDVPVDGVFCDFPDVAVRVRDGLAQQ
jgi:glycerophosphoryl diester phosphodiesterase